MRHQAMAMPAMPMMTTIMPRMLMMTTLMPMMSIVIAMTTVTTTSIAITSISTAIPMLMTTSKPPAEPRRRKVVRAEAAAAPILAPIPAPVDAEAITGREAAALYRLMTWLSPAFPVGAFSYSSGIEWAVEAGDIADAASLSDWLAAMLAEGSGFCDGVFLAHAHRAAALRDQGALRNVALRNIAE